MPAPDRISKKPHQPSPDSGTWRPNNLFSIAVSAYFIRARVCFHAMPSSLNKAVLTSSLAFQAMGCEGGLCPDESGSDKDEAAPKVAPSASAQTVLF